LEKIIDIPFWTWKPCISIGPFKFGKPIDNYIEKYNLCENDVYSELTFGKEKFPTWMHTKSDVEPFENSYIIPEYDFAFVIYTKYEIIDNIGVETYLYYNNKDIIDTSLEEAMKIINRTSWDKMDTQEVIDDMQNIYYFYDLGLTLWTLDGKVVSASCDNGVIPNDDEII
jgi:hypothetical protein